LAIAVEGYGNVLGTKKVGLQGRELLHGPTGLTGEDPIQQRSLSLSGPLVYVERCCPVSVGHLFPGVYITTTKLKPPRLTPSKSPSSIFIDVECQSHITVAFGRELRRTRNAAGAQDFAVAAL
jgi:hypothetical protein